MPVGTGRPSNCSAVGLSTAAVGMYVGHPGSASEEAWPVIIPVQKRCLIESRKDDKVSCRFQVGKLAPKTSQPDQEQNKPSGALD